MEKRYNPLSFGKRSAEEINKEKSLPENEQFFDESKRENIVPTARKHKSEDESLPPASDSHEKEKKEEWQKVEKEFDSKLEEMKKADKSIESEKHEGDSGSQYVISKNDKVVCSITLSKDRILIKSKQNGPQMDKFFPTQKDKFFRKFEDLFSK